MGVKNAAMDITFVLYIFNIFTRFWGIINREMTSMSVTRREFSLAFLKGHEKLMCKTGTEGLKCQHARLKHTQGKKTTTGLISYKCISLSIESKRFCKKKNMHIQPYINIYT